MNQTVSGKPVEVHFVAVFNSKQEIIGDALHLVPPGIIEMQMVGDKMGFQFWLPKEHPEIGIVLSKPDIVGIALLNEDQKFLTGFSIPGHPETRKEGETFMLRSRYIIVAPRKQMS